MTLPLPRPPHQRMADHVWAFVRTDDDWADGDEINVYRCHCGATHYRHLSR